MHIYYRITSIPSSNPSPLLQENKNALNEICLLSFLRAFRDIKPHITFICDFCDCQQMIARLCLDFEYTYDIISSEVGQNQTMLDSYRLAAEGNDDIVWFQESDYIYRPEPVGKLLEKAINQLGFVSPYDHPNFYIDRNLHSPTCDIQVIDGRHFRTAERNTMTWGTKAELVRKHRKLLDREGYLDGLVWYELKEAGHPLWVALPALATHMAEGWLAHGSDWKEIWQTLQQIQT